jgi:hypothetical protein
MVLQNPANKGVIAKIVFPKGLLVKCEAPGVAGGFFLISILSISVWVELIRQLYFVWVEGVRWF